MRVRRVVTGHDGDGKSVFVDDGVVEPTTLALTPTSYTELWRADEAPTLPSRGVNGPKTTFFPPFGGYRFIICTIPSGDHYTAAGDIDLEAGIREMQEKMPGAMESNEIDNPGMHTTDTVDMAIIVSGEVVLELDDGAETTLRAGDVYIQNGTRHRWHNRGSEPADIAIAIIGGSRTSPA